MDSVQRANNAKRILDDELYQEAFNALRDEILGRWEHSLANEDSTRETLWLSLQLLERLRRHLESVITTGKLDSVQKESPAIF